MGKTPLPLDQCCEGSIRPLVMKFAQDQHDIGGKGGTNIFENMNCFLILLQIGNLSQQVLSMIVAIF